MNWRGSETIAKWEKDYLEAINGRAFERLNKEIFGPSSEAIKTGVFNEEIVDEIIKEVTTEIILEGCKERAREELKVARHTLIHSYMEPILQAARLVKVLEEKETETTGWLKFVDDLSYILSRSIVLLQYEFKAFE